MTPLKRAAAIIAGTMGTDDQTAIDIARIVVRAIREPSQAMIEAGHSQYDYPEDVWKVMIDAALEDG